MLRVELDGHHHGENSRALGLALALRCPVVGRGEDLARWFRGFGEQIYKFREMSSIHLLLVSIGCFRQSWMELSG